MYVFRRFRRRINARVHNRMGPPLYQPFLDVWKLWHKKPCNALGRENIFYKLAPLGYLISTFGLFLFIPFSLIAFKYDFILMIYITILCSGFYVLAAFSTNSPWGILGSMREMITMVVYEITFAIVVFTFMLSSNVISLGNFTTGFAFLKVPLAAFALIAVASIEIKITPSDTAEAPTEILDGYKTEFSGKELALIEIVNDMKFGFFIFLSVLFFIGNTNLFLFVLGTLFFTVFYAFNQATTCRWRVDQTFWRYFIVFVLALLQLGWVMLT